MPTNQLATTNLDIASIACALGLPNTTSLKTLNTSACINCWSPNRPGGWCTFTASNCCTGTYPMCFPTSNYDIGSFRCYCCTAVPPTCYSSAASIYVTSCSSGVPCVPWCICLPLGKGTQSPIVPNGCWCYVYACMYCNGVAKAQSSVYCIPNTVIVCWCGGCGCYTLCAQAFYTNSAGTCCYGRIESSNTCCWCVCYDQA